MKKRTWLAIVLAMLTLPAWAGGLAVIESGGKGERASLEFSGDKIRLEAVGGASMDGYMVVHGERVYAVTTENGQPRVLDMAVMGKMLGAMIEAESPVPLDGLSGEVVDLQPLGRAENVAGIDGAVYLLTYRDEQGQHTDEVVLSTDPRALELTETLLRLSRTLAAAFGQPAGAFDELDRLLLNEKRGLLRFGSDMRVVSLSADTPAAERFVLPGEPAALPDFGTLMKEAARQVPEAVEALDDLMKALEGLGNHE